MRSINLPSGLAIPGDTLDTAWLEDRIATRPGRVGEYFPPDFEAFARILHPTVREADGAIVRWAEACAESGIRLTPATSWFLSLGGFENKEFQMPFTTSLPQPECGVVVKILMDTGSDSVGCWFGWSVTRGVPFEKSEQLFPASGPEPELIEGGRIADPNIEAVLPTIGGFYLVCGSLQALLNEAPTFAPSIWWPDSHEWLLATLEDAVSTYVAGTRKTIQALIQEPRLEVLTVDPSDSVVL